MTNPADTSRSDANDDDAVEGSAWFESTMILAAIGGGGLLLLVFLFCAVKKLFFSSSNRANKATDGWAGNSTYDNPAFGAGSDGGAPLPETEMIGKFGAPLVAVDGAPGLRRRASQRVVNLADDRPHDFGQEFAILWQSGTLDQSARLVTPSEVQRSTVTLLERQDDARAGVAYHRGLVVDPDTGTQTEVAIKMTDTEAPHVAHPYKLTDLLMEVAVMSQFTHRNVVEHFGCVTLGNPAMLITPYFANRTLLRLLIDAKMKSKRGEAEPISVPIRLDYCSGIAQGMAFLTSNGFVHRDLNASSVVVNKNHDCKISEFALSGAFSDGTAYRPSEEARLAVRWAAIEVLDNLQFTESSDAWSFAMTCIEIFQDGEAPYTELGWSDDKVREVVVRGGYKHPQPAGMLDVLYSTAVLPCLASDYTERPTFTQLVARIDDSFSAIFPDSTA